MNRQGYFFLIDAVIASLIVFAGLLVIFSGGVTSQDTVQPLKTVDDLFATLATQPISSTLDPYYTGTLLANNLVPFPELTPLEQIVYLQQRVDCSPLLISCKDVATAYAQSLIETTLGSEYGVEIKLTVTPGPPETIFRQEHPQRYQFTRSFVVYSKKSDTEFLGPFAVDVSLWS